MSARTRKLVRRSGAAALAIGLAASLVPPAATAATPRRVPAVVSVANGAVGVPQTVHVSAPSAAGSTVTVQLSRAGATGLSQPVSLDARGAGGFTWVPTTAGTWTASGVPGATAATVLVAPIPTRTALIAPNQTPSGDLTVLRAQVTATGTYLPVGTVTFTNAFTGEVLGTAAVGGTSTGTATGQVSWRPTSPTGYRLTASYAAADGSAAGSSSTNTSQALPNGPLVSLLVPPTFRYGEPVTITTRINSTLLTGGVQTWIDDDGAITVLPQEAGVIEQESAARWTPSSQGNQLVYAGFSSNNSSRTGQSVQWVYVDPARTADPMSVVVGGVGPLTSTPARVRGGAGLPVSGTAGSGAPVTFDATGPCYLVGATLVTPASGGTCGLVARSGGAGQFGPNVVTFPLTVAKRR